MSVREKPKAEKPAMELPEFGMNLLNRVPPRLLEAAERYLKSVPLVRDRLNKETDALLVDLEGSLKPYRGSVPGYERLPAQGRSREEVLALLQELEKKEEPRWREGLVSGAVYNVNA